MPYKVFISHGSDDAFVVNESIVPRVAGSGAEVFVDEGRIEFGDDFRARILTELSEMDELLVLLTVSSIERPWVFAEIGAAASAGRRIVPIRYGPRDDQLQALGVLSLLGHALLLELNDLDRYADQLAARVEERANA